MITSIEISGLRGIRQGKIEGLAPLSLIVGPNGCGKSAVLEAAGVLCAGGSASTAYEALASREWLGAEGMKHWVTGRGATFSGVSDSAPQSHKSPFAFTAQVQIEDRRIILSTSSFGAAYVDVNDGGTIITESPKRAPFIPFALRAHFVDLPIGLPERLGRRLSSALRDALSVIKLSPWHDDWIAYLRELRPKITSIESIALGERDEPFVFEGSPRVGYPLAYAGDGFRRSLLLAAAFAEVKGGVVAIDEPEAFAHPTMFTGTAKLARRAVNDGTQVLIATHSTEFISAALQEFGNNLDKVAVIGLRRDDGVLNPVVIAGPDASRRVLELGHDLRL